MCGNKEMIPWHTEKLQITLLGKYKIIGVSSKKPIPNNVSTYSTIFNITQETLIGPRYRSGIILHQIFNPKKKWKVLLFISIILRMKVYFLDIYIRYCSSLECLQLIITINVAFANWKLQYI